MTKAQLPQWLEAMEPLDSRRRLTEAEEQVHLIRSVVEQGFSAVLITTADRCRSRRTLLAAPPFLVRCRAGRSRDLA
jgi:hypothetical protein